MSILERAWFSRRPKLSLLLPLPLGLFLATGLAAGDVETPAPFRSALSVSIDPILDAPGLSGGISGVVVARMDSGHVFYARNAGLRLMPASNLKLLTSAAALLKLGEAHRYRTEVRYRKQNLEDGRLYGDLYLVGGGDPTLMPEDLGLLAEQVRQAGIRRIVGRVVGDDSRFDAFRFGEAWSWDYLSEGYAAPVSALNLNRNVIRVMVEPGDAPGSPARVKTDPDQSCIPVDSGATTGQADTQTTIRIERPFGSDRIVVSGSIAVDENPSALPSVRIAVPNPALFAASVFAAKLRAAGVAVDFDAGTGPCPDGCEAIGHDSPPISEIVNLLNKPSDNLIAECLLKSMSPANREASAAAGRSVALEQLRNLGLDTEPVRMADGSGLSRRNFVTARFLADLLSKMAGTPVGKVFRNSLPVAGVDGTLANRMKGTLAQGNVLAKTGFIGEVSSLSGYVRTKYGEDLVFAIIMNNHPGTAAAAREAQDRIAVLLAGWNSPAG